MLPLADLHALRFSPQRDRYCPSGDPVALRARTILRQMDAERKAAAKARRKARRAALRKMLARACAYPMRLLSKA